MNDVESELRRYGRQVLDRTRPVELDDVMSRASSRAPSAPVTRGPARPWALVAAAALMAVAVAGVALLDQRPGDDDPVVPATEPDSLIELPLPSTTDPYPSEPVVRYMVDTPIGTIEWNVIEGDSTELPIEVIDHPTPSSVRGRALDGTPMLSTDGGRSWQPDAEPIMSSAGGHAWTTVDGQLFRLSDRETPVRVPIPSAAATPGGPWEISTHAVPSVPFELDGNAYLVALTGLRLDFAQVINDPDVDGIVLHVGDGTIVTKLSDDSSPTTGSNLALHVVENRDSRRIDLVDSDDVTVASIDADVAGYEEFAPTELLFGANLVEWLRFDGTSFVPVDTPLPPRGRVEVARLEDTALILSTTGPLTNPDPPSLWRTDGTNWETVQLPGPDTAPSPSADTSRNAVRATLTSTNEGAVLTMRRDDVRHDLTTDGVNFREVVLPSNASGRERIGNGWISFVNGPPTVHVSRDGNDWDRISLSPYYNASGADSGQLFLIGSTIYIVITGADTDDLTLLIGDLMPSTAE